MEDGIDPCAEPKLDAMSGFVGMERSLQQNRRDDSKVMDRRRPRVAQIGPPGRRVEAVWHDKAAASLDHGVQGNDGRVHMKRWQWHVEPFPLLFERQPTAGGCVVLPCNKAGMV